jgi:hypothetical protein
MKSPSMNERKHHILIDILIGLIVTVVGGVIVAYIIQDARFKPTEESLNTETLNWAFVLEYRFPAAFWSSGTHQYSFTWLCPNEAPDSVTREFRVSENFAPITDDVYLRWSSLRVGSPFGDEVQGINPSQTTVAAVAWNQITKSEAEWRAANCTGTVSWDNEETQPLTAQKPFKPE